MTLVALAAARVGGTANVWHGGNTANPQGWEVAENWSAGKAPGPNDGKDVVLPAGLAKYPVLSKDVVIDGSLTIEGGAGR